MIEYIEIRGADTKVNGIIDTAQSIIWHAVYFGVGDFEIYAAATPEIIGLLLSGHYVTRPDNAEVGIIERVEVSNDIEGGRVITASGRFVKSILDRRLIYNLSGNTNTATILRGNVETVVREIVQNNAIACAFDTRRNIDLLALGDVAGIPDKIVDENGNAAQKQVSYQNLLEYTDELLQEYGIASRCILAGGKFKYTVYTGADRSAGNTNGNVPVVFSREYDNLTGSEYEYDFSFCKNTALIGGEGEGLERFYSLVAPDLNGLQRREIFVDASSISKTYKDENNEEQTYTDAEYKTMLDAAGRQELTQHAVIESFTGTLDTTNGNYVYGRDFGLGDIVTVQDNEIGKYINVRISEATEVQDENGYTVEVNYM